MDTYRIYTHPQGNMLLVKIDLQHQLPMPIEAMVDCAEDPYDAVRQLLAKQLRQPQDSFEMEFIEGGPALEPVHMTDGAHIAITAALKAAIDRDQHALRRSVKAILKDGSLVVTAAMAWIDTTMHYQPAGFIQADAEGCLPLTSLFDVETGRTLTIDEADPYNRWAIRLFFARANKDDANWRALWANGMDEPELLIRGMVCLLTTCGELMALAALAEREGKA